MISNKHITKVAFVLISVVLILCMVVCIFPDVISSVLDGTAYSMEYEEKLFDTSEIIDINIIIEDSKWDEMLENAMSEEYAQCDVVINEETFYGVGIRPKGNTSLSSVARDPDNNRYSFKLEFDKFSDGGNCFGLDKLVLNNNYADATNMKEAIIYDMFEYIGADAPLYNYAKISVNSEYWGVYLALEAVEDSFMLRNYGAEKGNLYKPDNMNFGGGAREERPEFNGGNRPPVGGGFPEGEMPRPPEGFMENMPQNQEGAPVEQNNTEGRKGGFPGGRGPGMGGNGSNLNYIDDNIDSYSAIWNGEVNNSTNADHKRVVTALKNVSEGTNIEDSLDVDNMTKYMAVHTFSVNEDSLSGGMAHNYYLYEANGKLNIIPWDYNLAFGGMHSRDASSVINDAIDDSFSSTTLFDVFLKYEKYLSQYHTCYSKLIDEYVYGGKFAETYARIKNQIDELVKTDPNAMYTYDEYVKATEMLYDTINLRAESVKGQLEGSIPSTSEGQRNAMDSLVDASSIDVSVMGSMGFGGRGGREGFESVNRGQNVAELLEQNAEIPVVENGGAMPQRPQGEMPMGMNFRGGNMPWQQNTEVEGFSFASFLSEYRTSIVSVILLVFAFVFIKLYKRKNY